MREFLASPGQSCCRKRREMRWDLEPVSKASGLHGFVMHECRERVTRLGEIMAELALDGRTRHPIAPLRASGLG